ncbi:MAG: endolytic transglycosylase MltG [Xanthomonadales bacterium]|nr:Endolytic murein transglycosylase [Xanthomonadales bacterium]MCC6594149.1 endolytic transglycosylase MltG [Xanthomonadales bacterium]MCE7931356.1 endolytic transglycosylase MltG [Xanthomonadales bacterium PRO6]
MPPPPPLGRIRWVLLLACLALALSAMAWFGWREFHRFEQRALGSVGSVITFERGMRLRELSAELAARGISDAPYWQWRLLAQRSGLAARLQAGEYRIEAGMTPPDLLRSITDGRVVQYRLTIVEGSRFRDLRVALAATPELEQTLGGLDDAAVLARIGATEAHPEGLFLPDTYFFPRGFADVELLRRAYWAQKRLLEQAWQARAPELPLVDAYQALILASVIEKETGRVGERRQIAGVFINRLRRGWRLQTDPSVIYGLGEAFDGNLRRIDLQTDTPYNTYTRFGLPPTPIALPGRAAIKAAVEPATTDAMYFVARGDGSHVFSRTLDEHNAAVRRFQLGR